MNAAAELVERTVVARGLPIHPVDPLIVERLAAMYRRPTNTIAKKPSDVIEPSSEGAPDGHSDARPAA